MKTVNVFGNYLYGAYGCDFVTSDGERVMVIGLTKRQWKSLCMATGTEQAMVDLAKKLGRDFSKEGDRFESREEISAYFNAFRSGQTFAQIQQNFNDKGVCWSQYKNSQRYGRN